MIDENNPFRRSGAACCAAWYAKQAALLPWRRDCALYTPPVRLAMSTPVKVLTLPVLPPTERLGDVRWVGLSGVIE